jgi:hypothetical protein
MATESPSMTETKKVPGPSGFITIGDHMLVVDYGKIYVDASPVGYLYEDGSMEGYADPIGSWQGLKTIDELPGCVFRGIDSRGLALELPGNTVGPTGGLSYNGVMLTVIRGRISTSDHRLVGEMNDACAISLFDIRNNGQRVLLKMDENSQMTTIFQGIKSDAKPCVHEWVRVLHRKDRSYVDNEVIRYFKDFDAINTPQKRYVLDTMKMWAQSGLLQVIRKSEGDAALGNVKHGASGVTGVRTGNVTLDREEFEKEIMLYKRFGALAAVQHSVRPYTEVRINLVVSHEFGHQLEFCLSQASQDRVTDIYNKRLQTCDRLHPRPEEYEGGSELLLPQQVEERIFISGYSRASMHEYWAEATAAFSVTESRRLLKQLDPLVYDVLCEVIHTPEKVLSPKFEKDIQKLQSSLYVGGEFSQDLLDS